MSAEDVLRHNIWKAVYSDRLLDMDAHAAKRAADLAISALKHTPDQEGWFVSSRGIHSVGEYEWVGGDEDGEEYTIWTDPMPGQEVIVDYKEE